jgi:hypothetical protein
VILTEKLRTRASRLPFDFESVSEDGCCGSSGRKSVLLVVLEVCVGAAVVEVEGAEEVVDGVDTSSPASP